MKIIFTILLIFSLSLNSFAQTKDDKVKARETALEAIKAMDKGEIDKSIVMLEESEKLDPKNYHYPYEIGYAYYLNKDYKNAIKTSLASRQAISLTSCTEGNSTFPCLQTTYSLNVMGN
ncbi:tetratricopeptide repeat protein [Cellulophaga baltica]|uniref:tetratricopeptide repeat protein n=1 Tax=Cellulophaga baltica TaxID=76594 RepID=UPI0037C89713